MSLDRKLKYLKMNRNVFFLLRVIYSLAIFLIFVLYIPYGIILGLGFAIIWFYLYRLIFVDLKLSFAIKVYEIEAIPFFENFLLILKSGCSIKNALIKTCNLVDGELSDIVKNKLSRKSKKTLYELIDDIIEEIPSSIICNIFTEIKEAYKNGNDLGDSIKLQLKYVRDEYNNGIIKYYRLIPLKIFIFSIVCLIMMIVLLLICC